MHKPLLSLTLLLTLSITAHANNGLINVKSKHSTKETADKLEAVLVSKGMKVFARINHTEGAKNAGIDLRPTELVIFGNPKVGAPLMQCSQLVAIDLPQKALIWDDAAGQTWLSYNAPEYLKGRHDISGCDAVIGKITKALDNFAKAATE
jgi:uncharacterized protein (DUF302 family)